MARKLLQIGKYYYPYNGGMESVLRSLCEGLVNKIDFVVLCSNTSIYLKKQEINGVRIVRSPRFGVLFSQPLNIFYGLHFLSRFFTKELIHIHSPNPLAEIFCTLLPNKQIIVTHHSDIIRQKLLKQLYLPLYKLLLNKAKLIIVPTKNHIIHSSVLRPFEQKCRIVPFGIKDDYFKANSAIDSNVIKIKQDHDPYVLFVGRLVGYKGIEFLIEAAKLINGKVIIIGKGILKAKLQQQIQDNNLEKKVFILGEVSNREEFVAYFHGARALVLPSISPNENFGIVQLEAMACSKPIITTNIKSGVPCVAEEGKSSILVPPESAQQLAKAINKLIDDPALAQEMGQSARKRYEELYTYEKMINAHLEIYSNLSE